ncbi:MAG: hypothetical protein QXW20_07425 [Ignisphaera sp.]
MSEEQAIQVPIIKLNPIDVEKFLSRLRERIRESTQTSIVKDEYVRLVNMLEDILMDLVSSTTSDVIVPPFVSDQILMVDALTMVSTVEKTILLPIVEEMNEMLESSRYRDYLSKLSMYIHVKKLCYDAIIQILKRRMTHIYINMPPNLRPSLGSAAIGYEKIE